MPTLFDPLILGDLRLPHRVIMAPLTRMRSAQPGNVPTDLMALYYAQRASAGLIISEATQICPEGQGYPATPGIHSPEQVLGWKKVTDAVHAQGGQIFLQLWHVGRISHSSHQPNGGAPVAPSAITPSGKTFTAQWTQVPYETPRALALSEIPALIDQYERAALNAQKAGFDGVEIHSANGYLLDQFLQTRTNQRTDTYGGSIENRVRLLREVIERVIGIWGHGRVGVRLSPYGTFNDISDDDPMALFSHVIDVLNTCAPAYVHMIEPRATSAGGDDHTNAQAPSTSALFRARFKGVFLSAGGYTPQSAHQAMEENLADAIVFGRFFISNPDLPQRIEKNAALTPYNRATFYGGDAKGYTDYPFLTQ